MNTPNTPTPWHFTHEGDSNFYIRDANGRQLIWMGNSSNFQRGENESLCVAICRSVNCHDGLVEALQAQEDAEEWIANADQTDPFFEETCRHKLTCCAALRSKALAKAGKGEG